jgi:hypothetical protein
VVKEYTPKPGVIMRTLVGGMLVLLSLPLLLPLIVGTLITGAINRVYVMTRRLKSNGQSDD